MLENMTTDPVIALIAALSINADDIVKLLLDRAITNMYAVDMLYPMARSAKYAPHQWEDFMRLLYAIPEASCTHNMPPIWKLPRQRLTPELVKFTGSRLLVNHEDLALSMISCKSVPSVEMMELVLPMIVVNPEYLRPSLMGELGPDITDQLPTFVQADRIPNMEAVTRYNSYWTNMIEYHGYECAINQAKRWNYDLTTPFRANRMLAHPYLYSNLFRHRKLDQLIEYIVESSLPELNLSDRSTISILSFIYLYYPEYQSQVMYIVADDKHMMWKLAAATLIVALWRRYSELEPVISTRLNIALKSVKRIYASINSHRESPREYLRTLCLDNPDLVYYLKSVQISTRYFADMINDLFTMGLIHRAELLRLCILSDTVGDIRVELMNLSPVLRHLTRSQRETMSNHLGSRQFGSGTFFRTEYPVTDWFEFCCDRGNSEGFNATYDTDYEYRLWAVSQSSNMSITGLSNMSSTRSK